MPPFQWPLPRLERDGTVGMSEHRYFDRGFALPADGVELQVLVSGREVARLVLLGDPDVALSLEERVIAVAVADQIAGAVAVATPDEVRNLSGY